MNLNCLLEESCVRSARLQPACLPARSALGRPHLQVAGEGPGPRGGHACVSLGGAERLLVFGGSDRTPVTYDDLWLLDGGGV
jgi:hypothetical protein